MCTFGTGCTVKSTNCGCDTCAGLTSKFALFMLEAALVGIPSLVPDHGAFPERISDLGQGWTYPADSQDALCQGIRTASTATTSRMSEQLQQSVCRKFSMDVTGPILNQVLQDIVN